MKTLTSKQINAKRKLDGKPPLNFRLIKKVIRRIETKPETYAQQVWGDKAENFNLHVESGDSYAAPSLRIGLIQVRRNSVQSKAQKLIGLTDGETNLFGYDAYGWLPRFRKQFDSAKSYRGEARAAVNYLKHICKTGQVIED